MGATGSGRQNGGRCTDDMRSLDVRKVHRTGSLTAGSSVSWQWSRNGVVVASINLRAEADRVVLNYNNRSRHRNGGDWEPMSYAVRLAWTGCALGGQRVWWVCPANGCGRRVALLHGSRFFACRRCHRLAYRSQRETDDARAMRRANAIRHRLGWGAGVLNGDGNKPKGMHWRTYWGLRAQYNDALSKALEGMTSQFDRLRGRLDEIGRDMHRYQGASPLR
jgi:hypothetical protein